MHVHNLLNQMLSYKSHVLKNSRYVKALHTMYIDIEPRKNGLLKCSHCGTVAPQYDTLYPPREFDFIPYCGMRMVFLYAMRRVECPICGHVYVEEVPWASGKSPITNELKAVLSEEARSNDTKAVAERYSATWEEVDNSVKEAVEYGLQVRDLDDVTQIGVDEIAWQKGHKYITLVYQLNNSHRRLLWVGEERTKDTMNAFFDDMEAMCKGFASRLEVVCTDMWKPFTDVIAARSPGAINILDRFHIVKMANEAVDDVRNAEYKERKKNGQEVPERTKYCFLKNPENLTARQALKLKELQKLNLRTGNAYLLKEQLRLMWDKCQSSQSAGDFLGAWIKAAFRSKLDPLKKVARTLRRKMTLILNYFTVKSPPSSGIVEGMNRKINLSIRKSYGFRCIETAKSYLLHQFGGLTSLPFTHKFC